MRYSDRSLIRAVAYGASRLSIKRYRQYFLNSLQGGSVVHSFSTTIGTTMKQTQSISRAANKILIFWIRQSAYVGPRCSETDWGQKQASRISDFLVKNHEYMMNAQSGVWVMEQHLSDSPNYIYAFVIRGAEHRGRSADWGSQCVSHYIVNTVYSKAWEFCAWIWIKVFSLTRFIFLPRLLYPGIPEHQNTISNLRCYFHSGNTISAGRRRVFFKHLGD